MNIEGGVTNDAKTFINIQPSFFTRPLTNYTYNVTLCNGPLDGDIVILKVHICWIIRNMVEKIWLNHLYFHIVRRSQSWPRRLKVRHGWKPPDKKSSMICEKCKILDLASKVNFSSKHKDKAHAKFCKGGYLLSKVRKLYR